MPRTINFLGLANLAVRQAAEVAVFGHQIADDLYGDLIGDIASHAAIDVTYDDVVASKNNKSYRIKVRANSMLFGSTIRLNPGEFEYSECAMKLKGTGIARLILHKVAWTAQANGFTSLVGEGSRFPGNAIMPPTNGYYTYPKYGFDAPIPVAVLATINPQAYPTLVGRTTVLDLMADDDGRKFWSAHGITLAPMRFELDPGSESWSRLRSLPRP